MKRGFDKGSMAGLAVWLRHLTAAFLCAVLAACGGGGGGTDGSGSPAFGGTGSGGGGGGGTSAATGLVLTLSAGTIANDGTQTVTAIATTVDANNNTVAAVPVTISVDSGVATPSGTVTDASGTLFAVIGIGSDHSNRTINVTAVSGSLRQVAQLQVVSASSSAGAPRLAVSLSSPTVTSAAPATVTAAAYDASGSPVPNVVVNFTTSAGLGSFSATSALTDSNGTAKVTLSPANATVSGADYVVATATVNGTVVSGSAGFSLVATVASITSFTTLSGSAAQSALSAYGQTVLTVNLTGASAATPVTLSIASVCVAAGKAKISPATFTATSGVATFTYLDTGGCGSTLATDTLTASISGTTAQQSLQLYLSSPKANNVVFVSSTPSIIYLQGTGLTTSSQVVFQVNDPANNPLPGQVVTMALSTYAGGLTINSGGVPVSQTTDSNGQVTALVNSGTVPTPVRVTASLASGISTVSSNLSVAVGLPAQLNFSLSQQTRNIEGFNVDGTANTYNIIASDRSGNPVPAGTTINFVAEGGQVEAYKQIELVAGIARASAAYASAGQRPADGRVTITAYALGEESFIDQNGNNVYDLGEPFQDLGNIFKDRIFDGIYDPSVDEYVSTGINSSSACVPPSAASGATAATNALLALDATIPSTGGNTCDAVWSGAGKVYVRRATETVLSTSGARALWGNVSGLPVTCSKLILQDGARPTQFDPYTRVMGGDVWYSLAASTALEFIVADANTFPSPDPASGAVGRLNPMAAGTTITATTPTTGLTVQVNGGAAVPSSTEATRASVGVNFVTTNAGKVFVTFTSPSGVGTTYGIDVRNQAPPSSCSP